MTAKLDYREYTYTLAGGAEVTIPKPGSFVRCMASNLSTFQISVDDGPFVAFKEGQKYSAPIALGESGFFTRIRVKNPSASSLTVTMALGFGDIEDDTLILSGAITTAVPSGLTTTADVSVAAASQQLLKAANTGRAEIMLVNNGTATMRIGDSNAAAAQGVPLAPGASTVLTTAAAVYAYNTGASAGTVSILETEA